MSLEGRVALVTGATRGAGRGTAVALGEAGATVYCTGRSSRGQPSSYNRPETIDDTADMVTAIGGRGIAMRVDHSVDADVKALFARVVKEQQRLDVLVNCIGGENPLLGGWTSFWQADLEHGSEALQQSFLSSAPTPQGRRPS